MHPTHIGRYEIISVLGQGGMGIVYLARDPHIGRQVAIKLLSNLLPHDSGSYVRFEREARIIARLEHPAIVPIYDFGTFFQDSERPYFVMRYMAGGSLSKWIQPNGLPLETALSIVKTIGKALHEAHQADVIHRDCKPSNILLDNRGAPFLSDFGIVKESESAHSLTGSSIIGTPAYMSPEQGRNDKNVDHRTDQYALGVILFELLTGLKPFPGNTIVEQIVAHATHPVPSISQNTNKNTQEFSDELDYIIAKAMAKNPDARFESTLEMVNALDHIQPNKLGNLSPSASGTQSTHTAVPSPKSKGIGPWVWISSIILLVLSLGSILWFFGAERDNGQSANPIVAAPNSPTSAAISSNNTPTIESDATPPINVISAVITPTVTIAETSTLVPFPTETQAGGTPAEVQTETPTSTPEPIFSIVSLEGVSSAQNPSSNLELGIGEFTLLGVPFYHGWKASTQCANNARNQTSFNIPLEGKQGTHLHLLVQAGAGFEKFNNQPFISLIVVAEDSTEFPFDLILGVNVRDWRLGELAEGSDVVTTVSSSAITEAWRGDSGQNGDGIIDKLTIELDDEFKNIPLRQLRVLDNSVGSVGSMDPCIHLSAITLER
ncbi:MAG: protein kinase [Chloroflexota bacterium]